MAEGKKSRKFGRNAKRPAQKRYVMELRSEKNKRLKIEAAKLKKEADVIKALCMKVSRGTARVLRRKHLNI